VAWTVQYTWWTVCLSILFAVLACHGFAQNANRTLKFANNYYIRPDITYVTVNNYAVKLDVYERRDVQTGQPTLIYFHAGAWAHGTKEGSFGYIRPYLETGWNVINVEYRLAKVALAPAAVEDCLCALRWVAANARQFHIDTHRLVLTGSAAGAHLALTIGMIPESAGLDSQCPGVPLPKVAAIIDWMGITDVNDLLDGPHQRWYAVDWLSNLPSRQDLARRVSPKTSVRAGLPPILMIHGDNDAIVPYEQSVRLKEALNTAGVPNQLFTAHDGKHEFTIPEIIRAYQAIDTFLKQQGLFQHQVGLANSYAPGRDALAAKSIQDSALSLDTWLRDVWAIGVDKAYALIIEKSAVPMGTAARLAFPEEMLKLAESPNISEMVLQKQKFQHYPKSHLPSPREVESAAFVYFSRDDYKGNMVTERIYIDAHPDHAAEVLGFVVRALMGRPGIMESKVAGPSSLPTQADSIVFYACSLVDVDWALELLSKYQTSHPDFFRPELCAGTRLRLIGISTAAGRQINLKASQRIWLVRLNPL
jgi:acetyl esterase/lipase